MPTPDEPGREAGRFAEAAAPQATRAGERISLPSTVAPDGAETINLTIAGFDVVGSTVYTREELLEVLDGLDGPGQPLTAIYEAARRITARYGDDGYVLSRAIVPPQELDPAAAVIQLRVIEGYVDRVVWPEQLSRYRDLFSGYAATITAERPSNIDTVTRTLLLAGDLPGLDVRSRFEPGTEETGAATLIVEVAETPVEAVLRVDNRGTEARGPYQYGGTATFNNLLGFHGAFTLAYGGSFEFREMQYVAGRYSQVLNSSGLTFFADASYSVGRPGTEALELLEFRSRSFGTEGGFSYPLIRSREMNLTVSGSAFGSRNTSWMLGTVTSDDALRGVRLGFDFDIADRWNGVTQAHVVLTQGLDAFGSTGNANPLASRENGRADFTTLAATVSRWQSLGGGFSLFLSGSWQLSRTPLLAPQECGYGGREIGRGFDPSELTGDHCISGLVELRYDPPVELPAVTQLQLYGFVDAGTAFRIAPAAGVPETVAGASAGVGLRLGLGDIFNADLSVVKPLVGREDDGWRVFFSASARF